MASSGNHGIRRLTAPNHDALVRILRKNFAPACKGIFTTYWSPGQEPSQYDEFRVSDSSEDARSLDCVPLEEILAAVRQALDDYGSFDQKSAPKVIATMFGFSRTGQKIKDIQEAAMEYALELGVAELSDGRHMPPGSRK